MTSQMRDGSTADDPRLGRLAFFDPRSRNYQVRERIEQITSRREDRARFHRPGPTLDQRSEGQCFPGATLIRLADGSHRQIGDVRVLDEVVTAEGRTGIVTETMVRRYSGALLRLIANGHSHLRATPEHPILTKRGYVALRDVVVGDMVALPRYTPPGEVLLDTDVVRVPHRGVKEGRVIVGHGPEVHIAAMPSVLVLSPVLGRLVGLYAAEGSASASKVQFAFGGHEAETLVPETVDLIKSAFDAEARVQVRPAGNINVLLYGRHWVHLFRALVPGSSRDGSKRLSAMVTNGPSAFTEAVFWGWMAGDGHERETQWQGVSVARQLALDLYAIAQGLGYRPVIRHSVSLPNLHAKTRQPRWDVTVTRHAVESPNITGVGLCACGCGQQVSSSRHRPVRYVSGHSGYSWAGQQDAVAVWRPVREVVPEPYEGWVHNLEVEGDHSYVAEGVGVHNCVAEACHDRRNGAPLRRRPVIDDFAERFAFYETCQHRDYWPGCVKGHDGPAYGGTSVLAGMAEGKDRGWWSEYRWIGAGSGRLEDDVIDTLRLVGGIVFGIPWLRAMYSTNPEGLVEVDGDEVGGHAIHGFAWVPRLRLRHSFRGSKPAVAWHNSWGDGYGVTKYGRTGVGFILLDDLLGLLENGRGEGAVPLA